MKKIVNNNIDGSINPVYIVAVEDPTNKTGLTYYRVEKILDGHMNFVEFQKCYEISKTEYTKLSENKETKIKATKALNPKIPWGRIIKIVNTIYNK